LRDRSARPVHGLVNPKRPMLIFSRSKKLLTRARRSIDGFYLRSGVRNAILAARSRPAAKELLSHGNRFVLFLVPGANLINGGALSIFSIAAETRKLLAPHGVTVAVCTAYNEPRILHYTKFDNDFTLYSFADLLPRLPPGAEIMVHVPEMFTRPFVFDCPSVYRSRPDLHWHFNILLQNIDLIPPREHVALMQSIGPTTTTTAHRAYASAETAQRLGCPVHFLSTWICPEEFDHTPYSDKRKLIVVSPDYHPKKAAIISEITRTLPDHTIVEIFGMTYRQYRGVVKDAKFAFTFGEGLDGYFIETIFTGGIGMAIYNDRFFTPQYRGLDGVFADENDALARVSSFITSHDDATAFRMTAARQFDLVARNYSQAEYRQNIKDFYAAYFPGKDAEARPTKDSALQAG
jgi:hypothetical protein